MKALILVGAQGLSYGRLFIGRLAARGEVANGVGRVDASIAGRRGGRFALDLNALFRPEQIAVAARGEFAGRAIAMPRRAVLTSLDGGGWRLDHVMCSAALEPVAAAYHHEWRLDGLSDHSALEVELVLRSSPPMGGR